MENEVIMSNAMPIASTMLPMQQYQSVPFDPSTGLLLYPGQFIPNLGSQASTSGTPRSIANPQNIQILSRFVASENSLGIPTCTPEPIHHQASIQYDRIQSSSQNQPSTSQILPTENRLGNPTYAQEPMHHQTSMQYNTAVKERSSTAVRKTALAKKKYITAKAPTSSSNKTYPSLNVNMQPYLKAKPNKAETDRFKSDLDVRVRCLLLLTPLALTKWLMQCGLLRLEQKCGLHMTAKQSVPYKLGMYSDFNKQPFSGGYVWISDCCPNKDIPVYHGSIFEAALYPPEVLIKLIYHWACETTVKRIPSLVQVSHFYVKNFFTLLRSACAAAIHEICPIMGGNGKYLEVGVITLGCPTAIQKGKGPVKIDILGVFDPSTKMIRMKVINPHNDGVSSATDNPTQILWPLNHWVDKSSILVMNDLIDKTILMDMGFKNVLHVKTQRNCTATSAAPSNANVMNYLHYIVPSMFKSALCDLSKHVVQQSLDELSWRELWGSTPPMAFDHMIYHLASMTKWDTGEPLITRLNKFSNNPFQEWPYSRISSLSGIKLPPDYIRVDMPAAFTVQTPVAIPDDVNGLDTFVVKTKRKALASMSSAIVSQLHPSTVMNTDEMVID